MRREFYWSKSSISTIRRCPRRFEHTYLLHTEPHTPISWGFGKAIHLFLDKFYWQNYQSADSFVKQWRYDWFVRVRNGQNAGVGKIYIPLNVENPENFFKAHGGIGANILRRFYNRHINNRRKLEEDRERVLKERGLHKLTGKKRRDLLRGISIEAGLFPVSEKLHRFEYGGCRLQGKIDRIDILGSGYVFTDYKTSGPFDPKTSLYVRKNPIPKDQQFEMYWLAMTDIFGEPPKAGFIHNLKQDTIATIPVSELDIDGLLEALKEAEDIRDFSLNQGFEKRITPLCDFCDYHYVCLEEEPPYPQELSELEAALEAAWGEPE